MQLKKLGNKLSIVRVILLLAAATAFSAGYIVMECYPQLYRRYKTIDKYLELGTFAALIVFFLVAGIIASYKRKRN